MWWKLGSWDFPAILTRSYVIMPHAGSLGLFWKVFTARTNCLEISWFLHYPLTVWSHVFTGFSQGGKLDWNTGVWLIDLILISYPVFLVLWYPGLFPSFGDNLFRARLNKYIPSCSGIAECPSLNNLELICIPDDLYTLIFTLKLLTWTSFVRLV